jgi:hypothetical protein
VGRLVLLFGFLRGLRLQKIKTRQRALPCESSKRQCLHFYRVGRDKSHFLDGMRAVHVQQPAHRDTARQRHSRGVVPHEVGIRRQGQVLGGVECVLR